MTTARHQRDKTLFLLIGILWLALALRLFRLGVSSLRGDEAFAIQYWAAPWPDALRLAGQEPHPLGTFALFSLWKGLFGDGEWAMRLLPTLLSLPGVAVTWMLGRQLFGHDAIGRRVAPLAALLYAIHPFLIWHAQDVRNYALWAAFSPLAAVAFLIALRRNRRRDWLCYALASAVSAYVFFLEPLMLAAQGVYLLLARRDRWRSWLLALAGLGVLLLPWLAQLLVLAGSGYSGTAGHFDAGQLLTWFLPVLVTGDALPTDVLSLLWLVLLPVGVVTQILLWKVRRESAIFLVVCLLVPLVALGLASVRLDVFRPRYVIPVASLLVLLVAVSAVFLTTRRQARWRSLGTGLLAALLLLNAWALANYYSDPAYRKAPDWRALGTYLTAHTQAGDLVVQQALDPAFTYYFRGPADETTLPLSANAPAEETVAILQEAITQRRAVWLVPAELPGYDDGRVPFTWLSEHTQRTADITIAEFRVLEFRAWDVRPDEYAPRFDANFEGVVTLLDWQVERLSTDMLRVLLYWQPQSQTPRPLHGFAHLVGPPHPGSGSPLWTQDDHRIPGGPLDSTNWQSGVIHRDAYLLALPADLPDGPWTLHIGLYDPASLDRLRVAGQDHLEIPLSESLLPRGTAQNGG